MPRVLGRGDLEMAGALLDAVFDGGSIVAAEKLFEPGSAEPRAIGIDRGGVLAGLAVIAGRYLRVLAVAPAHRGVGIGSALLEAAGDGELIAAAEPGNYLTPGVPASDAATVAWLERRGFERTGEATNLIADPRLSTARIEAAMQRALAAGYSCDRVSGERSEVRELVDRLGGPAWVTEVSRADVFAARDRTGAYVGFAAHDGNNRGLGGFGPAATCPEHRGRGIGAALLACCLANVAAAGHARCTVGWIGPREFYQRAVDITGEERFVQLRRP